MKKWFMMIWFLLMTVTLANAAAIDQLAGRYNLILIYSSTCPHCQRFVPVFADVASHYHIQYYAFTMNGGTLAAVEKKTLPATQSIVNNFYQGIPKGVVPAVFLINQDTLAFLPVSVGEETEEQFVIHLNQTAEALFKTEKGQAS